MSSQELTYLDFAEEAESAERAEAWPQAAALWREAAERCSDPSEAAAFQANAARCDDHIAIDQQLAGIAKRVFRISTLEDRHLDRLDFHELGVWQIREALRLAYRAGRDAQ